MVVGKGTDETAAAFALGAMASPSLVARLTLGVVGDRFSTQPEPGAPVADPRTALITGGARGIGRAVGIALGAEGWRVAFCYRTSAADAEDTAAAIGAAGGEAMAVQADVSRPQMCAELVGDVERRWATIDALINCAGPYHRVPLMEESLEGWHEMFDHNLHPVFYLARLVAPAMQRRGWGRIITFSMVNAGQLVGQPQLTAHYIAKVGVLVLTRSLARVLAPSGITVNAVAPGFIDSGSMPAAELSRMTGAIPAGYVGAPEDAVAAVRFLLSEEARYVNGATIQVSGAWGV